MRTGHQAVPLVAQSAARCGILAGDSCVDSGDLVRAPAQTQTPATQIMAGARSLASHRHQPPADT